MADQGRWFKLWCSCLDDPDLDNLSLDDFGRWAKIGTYLKKQGTHGKLTIKPPAQTLCSMLKVSNFEALICVIKSMPNVTVTGVTDEPVTFSIEFCNWHKYQEDFSGDRVRKWRASKSNNVTPKKRREERRREEKRIRGEKEEKKDCTTMPLRSAKAADTPWPDSLQEIKAELEKSHCPEELQDPAYWERIDAWLGNDSSKVGYLDELNKYLAWLEAQPPARKHKNLKAGFRNWLSKAEYWEDNREQKKEFQKRRF